MHFLPLVRSRCSTEKINSGHSLKSAAEGTQGSRMEGRAPRPGVGRLGLPPVGFCVLFVCPSPLPFTYLLFLSSSLPFSSPPAASLCSLHLPGVLRLGWSWKLPSNWPVSPERLSRSSLQHHFLLFSGFLVAVSFLRGDED